MNTKRVCGVLLVSVILGGALVRAAEHRVSNAGEVAAAMKQAQPGDTLIMANGTWSDQHVKFVGEGTAEKPIVLRAETPGQVVLNGKSQLSIGGKFLVADGLYFKGGALETGNVIEFRGSSSILSQYCRLTNTAIEAYNPPSIETRYPWVSIYGNSNRVDHCAFQGQTHSGVTLVVAPEEGKAAEHVISGNYFGPRPPGNGNGFETIRIGTSTVSMTDARCVVEGNLFEKCDGEIEVISNKTCGNRYLHNTFREVSGCLTLRHGNNCVVDGNFFLGGAAKGAGGVRVIGENHVVVNNYFSQTKGRAGGAVSLRSGIPNSVLSGYFQVKNATIAFNTFVDNPGALFDLTAGYGDRGCTLLPENTVIANNLFVVAAGAASPIAAKADTPGIRWEGNLMTSATLGVAAPEGIGRIADAGLVCDADGIWRLAASSPARGAAKGDFAQVAATDMDGQPRVQPFDVGADQFAEGAPPLRPLKRADVGPAWMNR